MSSEHESIPASGRSDARFNTTHWSVVLAAGQRDSPQAAEALEKLCRAYWYPLYAFVRREGHDAETARDLVQEFFARLLSQRDLESVRRERGRFRSFILVALKHFLVNERLRAHAQKRGGGRQPIPLDDLLAEDRYEIEPSDGQSPDKIYERRWAFALLEKVLMQLQDQYRTSGKLRLFESLRGALSGEPGPSQAEIARDLGTSEGAVKQAVHRLRQQYRQLLRDEVAHTVATAGDVEEEMRHLIAVLRG